MPIAVFIEWKGAEKKAYDRMLELAKWETDVPKGAMFHIAAFTDDAMHITDLWESQADFDAFFASRIMPNTEKAGLTGQPNVASATVHRMFTPAFSSR